MVWVSMVAMEVEVLWREELYSLRSLSAARARRAFLLLGQCRSRGDHVRGQIKVGWGHYRNIVSLHSWCFAVLCSFLTIKFVVGT